MTIVTGTINVVLSLISMIIITLSCWRKRIDLEGGATVSVAVTSSLTCPRPHPPTHPPTTPLPKSNIKGLTIAEEIQSYDGLDEGFECVVVKPKKGFAILFTHNLLHEAMPPEISNSLHQNQRLILRTDVLVKRKDKPIGFAICPEEKGVGGWVLHLSNTHTLYV